MPITEAPKWLQDLIVEQALGLLDVDDLGQVMVTEITPEWAEIRCEGFTYTALRRRNQIV